MTMRYEFVTRHTLAFALGAGLAGPAFVDRRHTNRENELEQQKIRINRYLYGSAMDRYDATFKTLFVIAMDDTQKHPLVGYARMSLRDMKHIHVSRWMFDEVGVHSYRRREGIGTALFDKAVLKTIELNAILNRTTPSIAREFDNIAFGYGYRWINEKETHQYLWKMAMSFMNRHGIAYVPTSDFEEYHFSPTFEQDKDLLNKALSLSSSAFLDEMVKRCNKRLKDEGIPLISRETNKPLVSI